MRIVESFLNLLAKPRIVLGSMVLSWLSMSPSDADLSIRINNVCMQCLKRLNDLFL